ncbi:MAG: ferric reductase-like transmembrane domain-containing protein [Magnetococcales bacterium]|nr:ferric reductase-like transmembrane domain-containing protein [Magnetococcales bacterium]
MNTERNNTLYLLATFSTLMIALTIALQPLYLDDALRIPYEESGVINAHLVVVTELVSVLFIGYISFVKRPSTSWLPLFLGFLVAGIGAILAPLSHETQGAIGLQGLTFYYLMRVMISLGSHVAQLEITRTVGEFSLKESLPDMTINRIIMMLIGGGVICAILMQIPHNAGQVYGVMALTALTGILGAWLVKQKLAPRSGETGFPEASGVERDLTWRLLTQDPRMQLSLAAAFFVRADLIVLSLFLSMWHISIADLIGVSRVHAAAHAAALIGLAGLVALLAMPFWKRGMAEYSRVVLLAATLAISTLGYLLMGLVVNPFTWPVVIPLALIGFGLGGLLILPGVLTRELLPRSMQSRVLGLFHLAGGIGVIVLVQSGGYFFDAVGPRSPFALMGTGTLLLLFYALWLVWSGWNETAGHQLLTAKRSRLELKPMVFMLSLLPLLWLVGRILLSGYTPGSALGQMPVGFINRYLGDWAFNFLLISLSLRPIAELTGIKMFARYRRMIGLYAFFYALLHVVSFVWLEWNLNWNDILVDILKRKFTLLGVFAFLLLLLLAWTSTNKAIRQLGLQRWQKLHRLTYLANLLIAGHFIFAATHDNGEPYVYLIIVVLLLLYRLTHAPRPSKALPV